MTASAVDYLPSGVGSTKILDVTLTAAQQTYTLSNLPRDANQLYVRVKNPFAGMAAFSVRPNGSAANMTARWNFHDYTQAPAKVDATDFYLFVEGASGSSPVLYDGWFLLDLETGLRRSYEARGKSFDGSGSRTTRTMELDGFLNDSATPIDTVDLTGNAANCFAIGCKIRAWAIRF